ncbi:hypothetical protein [Streptomyces sp. NPDC059916]|uniref:hypothetical protein n=1 Tax=Streptomyces sp. NPDC059916 TaxID=3347001 RepID=UPI003682D4DD
MASNFTPDENELELLEAVAAALSACNEAGEPNAPVIARINLGPVDLHNSPDGYQYCHSADLTAAGLVEALKLLGAMPPAPAPAPVGTVDTLNSLEDQVYFASKHEDLAEVLTGVFADIDPRTMQATVLNNREVTMLAAVEAVDDVFGDLSDPLADEDGEL